ncbi:deoxyribodipyrimidine photolyase [Tenacibaculum sp. SZ-18]|uniref:cryptochrome/photolyase family protein n=1 Tax=Tenacibaculum sp. SZ-18 TaxID=754423 RepID=UPI000C2D1ED6|nr:deoxyribodipyrimidine photo-lyase [Tenacibaculum sp. SZ-18]AUC14200.1 deoxyribodipyrimidine photolyase [Tenacibaculum sp. SZ-18]
MDKISIFWFRRDLRLNDNHGLFEALNNNKTVLPIFIFDKNILDKLPKNDARVNFIHTQLLKINLQLKEVNSSLHVFYGNPIDIYQELLKKYDIISVYTNRDYEPYASERDQAILELLDKNNISFKSFKDQVIFEEKEITKDDGNPYKVYTPYSKKWLSTFTPEHSKPYTSEKLLDNFVKIDNQEIMSLDEMGFENSTIQIPDYKISTTLINEYEAKRNFPAINATSKLGIHLRFGTISVREAVNKSLKSDNITFLKELIWREFFMQILWHFPHTITKAFKPKYDNIEWRNNKEDFKNWCEGKTGYPLVDAGMRELNKTGFMHNRVRMLVGSFLCKHLLIDWRLGEAYFAEKLLDFELSSNIGNWQWVAGCGVDASPYFRIFNPTTQIQKFDKQLEYIKKWVPEFQELTYPAQIVDHKFARERCLETYKKALD